MGTYLWSGAPPPPGRVAMVRVLIGAAVIVLLGVAAAAAIGRAAGGAADLVHAGIWTAAAALMLLWLHTNRRRRARGEDARSQYIIFRGRIAAMGAREARHQIDEDPAGRAFCRSLPFYQRNGLRALVILKERAATGAMTKDERRKLDALCAKAIADARALPHVRAFLGGGDAAGGPDAGRG